MLFLSFSYQIFVSGTFITVLNNSGESGHPCLVVNFRGKTQFFMIGYDVTCEFFIFIFYLFNVYLFLRVGKTKRGRHEIQTRLQALSCQHSTEPDVGLELTSHEIMTRAKVGSLTD